MTIGAGDATIAVEALGVAFRQRRRTIMAVREVSFAVRPGETFGLVGESGSGKSTVLRAIAGLVPLAQGTIRIAGRSAGRRRSKAERRAGLPYRAALRREIMKPSNCATAIRSGI